MEKPKTFKEMQELLEKLKRANGKLQEYADKVNPLPEKEAVILPFKKHTEQ